MMEEFVSARAGNALDSLAKLLPDRVTVRRDGQDLVVSLEEVQSGDLVLIRSGDHIPVDGTVAMGTASVNQAAITGESLAVEKQVGDIVYAGTLNEVGALEVQTTKVGAETTLGHIRRMVEEAQEQKAPIERILDRYAKFSTPAALILGVLVWWWSGDILRAITILIVFCPCVMVLATPTALVASIGNAALRGSLVKKGATIEALAQVKREPRRDVGPIDDVPDRVDVVGSAVLVLQVVGVLPGVDDKQWYATLSDIALMVVDLFDEQPLAEGFPRERPPAGSLH